MSSVSRHKGFFHPGLRSGLFLSFLIVLCVVSFGFSRPARAVSKAPDFSLKSVNGKTYRLSAYRGKPVLLNFWATWCPDCRAELPSLVAMAGRFEGKLQVISVSIDSSEGRLKEYLKAHPLPFPVLSDPKREVAFDQYAVFGIPATFFIDKNGNLVKRVFGSKDWTSPRMAGKIEKLIKSK